MNFDFLFSKGRKLHFFKTDFVVFSDNKTLTLTFNIFCIIPYYFISLLFKIYFNYLTECKYKLLPKLQAISNPQRNIVLYIAY